MSSNTISAAAPARTQEARRPADPADPQSFGASLPKDPKYAAAFFGADGQARKSVSPEAEARMAAGFVNGASREDLDKLAADKGAFNALMQSLAMTNDSKAADVAQAKLLQSAFRQTPDQLTKTTCGFAGCKTTRAEPPMPGAEPSAADIGVLYQRE